MEDTGPVDKIMHVYDITNMCTSPHIYNCINIHIYTPYILNSSWNQHLMHASNV